MTTDSFVVGQAFDRLFDFGRYYREVRAPEILATGDDEVTQRTYAWGDACFKAAFALIRGERTLQDVRNHFPQETSNTLPQPTDMTQATVVRRLQHWQIWYENVARLHQLEGRSGVHQTTLSRAVGSMSLCLKSGLLFMEEVAVMFPIEARYEPPATPPA